jgi:glycosyltransferase involved in cell wall biosynthesis
MPAGRVADAADVTVGIPTRNRSAVLAKSIASVLRQSHRNFRLVVSDNASDDDTAELVASFADPRVEYRPLERDIGRVANTNRLIGLADTEFLLLLADDDELHPDHLSRTLAALRRWPSAGVAHTGYVIADERDNTLATLGDSSDDSRSAVFEPGARFVERSMRSGPSVCLSSAVFRRAALLDGGGLRPEDGAVDDFPLLMRIATSWDLVYVNDRLAVLRAHAETSSASLGSFTPGGFRSSRALPDVLYENRVRFLATADLPEPEIRRFARIAERTHRREILGHLSMRARTGDGQVAVLRALRREIRRDSRLWLDPRTWRFVAGSLGGRRIRDALLSR